MDERGRLSLLLETIRRLNEAESWTGRTHIQKYLYLAMRWLGLSVGYDFVLYQRGPYSFELDQDIRNLRSMGLTDIELMPAPYGPRYRTTQLGDVARQKWYESGQPDGQLQELASAIASKDARGLELLATAEWVLSEGIEPTDAQVQRLLELKSYFSKDQAEAALSEAKALRKTLRKI